MTFGQTFLEVLVYAGVVGAAVGVTALLVGLARDALAGRIW